MVIGVHPQQEGVLMPVGVPVGVPGGERPQQFELVAPKPGARFSEGGTIEVEWRYEGPSSGVPLTVTLVSGDDVWIRDSAPLGQGRLSLNLPPDTPTSCKVTTESHVGLPATQ